MAGLRIVQLAAEAINEEQRVAVEGDATGNAIHLASFRTEDNA
jgi:hypothetical protein